MKYIFLLLLLFSSFINISYAEDIKFYITWNLQTYDFKECNNVSKNLSLTYKWDVVSTTQMTYDNFQENERKKIWRFSFYISLPIEKLNLDDYRIISSEWEVYNLKSYFPKVRLIQENQIILPDIILFCNKANLDNIITKAYEEDKKSNTTSIFWFEDKKIKNNLIDSIELISEEVISDINIKILDHLTKEEVFSRDNEETPYLISWKEELSYFEWNQYDLIVSKEWYLPYKTTFLVWQKNIKVKVYLTKQNTSVINNILDTSENNNSKNNTNTNEVENNNSQNTNSQNNSNDSSDSQGSIKSKYQIQLVWKNKEWYSILVNWNQIDEWKDYESDKLEKKIEIFKDNKLIKTTIISWEWVITIDISESSIFYYVLWVSLSFFMIVVYFIVRKKYLVKTKKND